MLGTNVMLNFWEAPAGISTGVPAGPFNAPVAGSTGAKRNPAGTAVSGFMAHPNAAVVPRLVIVANAVANPPTGAVRPKGKTAVII